LSLVLFHFGADLTRYSVNRLLKFASTNLQQLYKVKERAQNLWSASRKLSPGSTVRSQP